MTILVIAQILGIVCTAIGALVAAGASIQNVRQSRRNGEGIAAANNKVAELHISVDGRLQAMIDGAKATGFIAGAHSAAELAKATLDEAAARDAPVNAKLPPK